MAASIDTIINKQGDEKYPKTVTSAIYDATTLERLDNVLATCAKNVSGLNLKMWVGTLDEYKAIAVKDASTLYFIKDIVEAV